CQQHSSWSQLTF
nr:immunoglobulin light chain junction region [Macaca mulatta]